MIVTFLIALGALIIAVLGCAWLRPGYVKSTADDATEHPL